MPNITQLQVAEPGFRPQCVAAWSMLSLTSRPRGRQHLLPSLFTPSVEEERDPRGAWAELLGHGVHRAPRPSSGWLGAGLAEKGLLLGTCVF